VLAVGRRDWLFGAGLLVAVVLVYQPAWNGGFLWDDAAHLTRPELRSWGGLWRIWFDPGATQQHYPLVHSAFWVQHRLWGEGPVGYHLVNIVLHAAVALLAASTLRRLSVPGAWLAAAIFALHPVHVESVAWISELKNTLSAALYLGAALAWLRFEEKRELGPYALALGLFVLALCSKTVIATLPAALLLAGWWRRGGLSWREDVRPLLPFFVLGAAAGLFTAWVERRLVGAEGAPFELSVLERALIAGRASWFYLGKLVWPANLTFIYPRWHVDRAVWWQYLYPAAALLALATLWAVRKRWRGPLSGALFFVGTLVPALGFVNVYPFLFSFVADHFQYLASLGAIAPAAALATRLAERGRSLNRLTGHALCTAAVVALAVLTWKQAHLYADAETLYRATIRANPGCWMAYSNLAGALIARGRTGEARALIERALELRPDYPEAHNNLGLVLAGEGRAAEAIAHYRAALRLDPTYAEAHNNLGFVLASRGEVDAAIAHYRTALENGFEAAGVHYNLAMALLGRGQSRAAAAHLQRTLELQPEHVQAHNNLGILLARSGRLEDAIAHFRRALEIDPTSAEVRRNLDIALTGRRAGATP